MNTINEQIGETIRKRRKATGMSQMELAAKINLSFQQVQKYENGSSRIPVPRLYDIARALNVHIQDFFKEIDMTDSVFAPPPVYGNKQDWLTPTPLDREEMRLLKRFRKINDTKIRTDIQNLVRDIARVEAGAEKATENKNP
ncbi:MAG: helix-turn-helix domain-containing protein [Thermodesulfobacteriota bacterium]|nr:helix-turn-helix domain-containing protein [Thermodesulfobacteriota bacterium]